MNDLIHFFLEHWALSGLFVILVLAVIYMEVRSAGRGIKKLSPQEVVQLINRDNAMIVDVRDRNAYLEGHIVNAMHVPPSELTENKKLAAQQEKNIILVCSNGMQSPALAAKLQKQDFKHLYYLSGGIAAWKGASLPVVK